MYKRKMFESRFKKEKFLTIVTSNNPSLGFGSFVTCNPPPEYLQIPNTTIKHKVT